MNRLHLCFALAIVGLASPASAESPIHISEVLASNQTGITDEQGLVSDWIELHNRSSEPQSLAGWSLTDTTGKARWTFPAVELNPDQYYIVFASGAHRTDPDKPLHTNFKLKSKGEYLGLLNPDGETAHELRFPKQKDDITFGIAADTSRPTQLAFPTPGRTNAATRIGKLSRVKLSQKHGLFQEPFQLTATAKDPDVTIRYTLDGSQPHESSPVLSEPMAVTKTTIIRVRGYRTGYQPTATTTRSYIFPEDRLDDSADGLPPANYRYKWWVAAANYGMDPALTKDPKYRKQILESLNALPSYSLVIKPDDLFSNENGIYAHAGWHGRRAERACSLELLPSDSDEPQEGFQIDCGVRMRGGSSRSPDNPKHGFRMFFRKQYGDAQLKYKLFGDEGAKRFDHIDLRCSQNYAWHRGFTASSLYVRDQYCRDTQLAMGHPSPRGNFRHLYINGHYWGLFNTCERPKASFGSTYMGGKKENFDVVKIMGGFSEGEKGRTYQVFATDGNMKAWEELDTLSQTDVSNLENYCRIIGLRKDGTTDPDGRRLLDPVNLIDYMLSIFHSGNFDAPISKFGADRGGNNWHGLINRKRNDGYRFIVWDAEHSLLDIEENRLGPFPLGTTADRSNPHWIYQRLLENEEFRVLLADRIARHMFRDGALTPGPSIKRMQRRLDEASKGLLAEAVRWGTPQKQYQVALGEPKRRDSKNSSLPKYEAWFREAERTTKEYLPKRTQVVLDQLFSQGLYPDLPEIESTWDSTGTKPTLQLRAQQSGICYTTNGEDPRLFGGNRNPAASDYEQPIPVTANKKILCRILQDDEWGPLREFSQP